MRPSISGNGTAQRSIENDDQAGVQFIYGVASGSKPTISSVSGSTAPGGTVVISGSNFSTTGNEAWFNDEDAVVPGRDADVAAASEEHINALGYVDDLDLYVIEVLLGEHAGDEGHEGKGQQTRQ